MKQPSEQIAKFIMCNILGKQTDPDWVPDPVTVECVHETIMNVFNRGVAEGLNAGLAEGQRMPNAVFFNDWPVPPQKP